MRRKWRKVTEGEGYVSGDYECFCIHPMPFDEWRKASGEERHKSIYPEDLFPPRIYLPGDDGVDYSRKVRYKVVVEVEELDERRQA